MSVTTRAGRTEKIIVEGARRIREQEGREALLAWLGPAADLTPEQRAAIHAEWLGDPEATKRNHAGKRRRAS